MLTGQVLYCPKCKNVLERMADEYFCQSCAHFYPIVDGIPSFVDQGMVVDSFDGAAFGSLFKMEQKHFWHIGRKEIILDVLRRNIPNLRKARMLELGCGNGSVLACLKQDGIDIDGGDIFMEALKFCQQRVESVTLYQTDVLAVPFRNDFDIIGLFDLLEHIDEDERALVEVSQALKPGGKILVTVPAHRFLWSYVDVYSLHKRRYNKRELTAKLRRNGFIIKKVSYFMFFLFPLLLVYRSINNILSKKDRSYDVRESLEVKTIPVVNNILLGLLRLEKGLLRYFALPLGVSLIVLAEKR